MDINSGTLTALGSLYNDYVVMTNKASREGAEAGAPRPAERAAAQVGAPGHLGLARDHQLINSQLLRASGGVYMRLPWAEQPLNGPQVVTPRWSEVCGACPRLPFDATDEQRVSLRRLQDQSGQRARL